jgi:hypothetical protein
MPGSNEKPTLAEDESTSNELDRKLRLKKK